MFLDGNEWIENILYKSNFGYSITLRTNAVFDFFAVNQ